MDLRELRIEALNDANQEIHERNVEDFKDEIISLVHRISENNKDIDKLKADNRLCQKQITEITLTEHQNVTLPD